MDILEPSEVSESQKIRVDRKINSFNAEMDNFVKNQAKDKIRKRKLLFKRMGILLAGSFVGGLLILSSFKELLITDYILSNWQLISGNLIILGALFYVIVENAGSTANFSDVDLRQGDFSPAAAWPFPTRRTPDGGRDEDEDHEEDEEDEEDEDGEDGEDVDFLIHEENRFGAYSQKEGRDQFRDYFEKVSRLLQQKSFMAESKASLLLDKGSTYTLWGILFFIASIITWQALSWVHGFKVEFIYGIASSSGLFIFIEIISGWYLKQYRHYVDTSTYLLKIKSMFDKFMLVYLSQHSLKDDDTAGRARANKALLAMLEKEIRWPNAYMLQRADANFAIEAVETLSKLSKRILSTKKKMKKKDAAREKE